MAHTRDRDSVTPLTVAGEPVLTLRQIDRLNGVPKGTAFRAFKRVRGRLREGVDFHRFDATTHGEWIERLRARGLVYPATVHLLVLTRSGYERLLYAQQNQQ